MSALFSEDSFIEKARELLKISEELNDTWQINEKDGKIYLVKKQIISVGSQVYSIEYNVAFHPTYQVPVLYFNAHNDSGCLVSLEQVSEIFMNEYDPAEQKEEIYKIISQADHPILFRPFYMIHPCHIHEVLASFPESKNFVLTFLTIFGPYVRLKMSDGYEKFYTRKENQ